MVYKGIKRRRLVENLLFRKSGSTQICGVKSDTAALHENL